MARRSYTGGSVPTELDGQLLSGGMSFDILDNSGWTGLGGLNGDFTVTINEGQSNEETLLCSDITGSTVTVVQRGYDDTPASDHASGSPVHHSATALDFDEANRHIETTDDDHLQYMRADGTRHDLTARHAIGTSVPAGTTPTIITPDAVAAEGAANTVARGDHTHGIVAAAPISVGISLTEGVATSFARSDHRHDIANAAIDAQELFIDSLRPPTATTAAPASPVTGQLWVDTDASPITLYTWDGVAWRRLAHTGLGEWTSYDPSWRTSLGGGTGVTLGTGGTAYGRWMRVGRSIIIETGFALGTAGNVTGSPAPLACILPFQARFITTDVRYLGGGRAFDTSAAQGYASIGLITNDQPNFLRNFQTAGFGNWTGTVPFNWGEGDTMSAFCIYEEL